MCGFYELSMVLVQIRRCSNAVDFPVRLIVIQITRPALLSKSPGLTIVFAAGNNQGFCSNPSECGPNSIWIWNSLDEVLSVGAVDQNNELWSYSSRGPGQWTTAASPIPDCVAPVFGEVMWN